MSYALFIRKSAQKALDRLETPIQERLFKAIRELSEIPRPSGCKKLVNRDAWRIRCGDYRIIYEIHDDRLVIAVIAVGHRRDIYD